MLRLEAKRKTKKEIHGCGEIGYEVSWSESRRYRIQDVMVKGGKLKEKEEAKSLQRLGILYTKVHNKPKLHTISSDLCYLMDGEG